MSINKKKPVEEGLSIITGVGFEPATLGVWAQLIFFSFIYDGYGLSDLVLKTFAGNIKNDGKPDILNYNNK